MWARSASTCACFEHLEPRLLLSATAQAPTIGPVFAAVSAQLSPTAAAPPLSLALQSKYSKLDLTPYDIANDAWSISTYAFHADANMSIETFINASDADVEGSIRWYLGRKPALDPMTTDLLILDIEAPVHVKHIGKYAHEPELHDQIILALKRRIDAARRVFPYAKLSLYGVIFPHPQGHPDSKGVRQQMTAMRRAGELGMFDNLDYISPNLFQRWGVSDKRYSTRVEDATRQGIEHSQQLTKSDGTPIALAPILSFEVFNPNSRHDQQIGSPQVTRLQTDILNQYPSVQRIVYWIGSDRRDELASFLADAAPIQQQPANDPPHQPSATVDIQPNVSNEPLAPTPGPADAVFAGRVKAELTDPDGTKVKIQLRGPGTGQLWLDGDGYIDRIELTGTTAASKLYIKTDRGGDAATRIGSVSADALGKISARTTDLADAITATGGIKKVYLRDILPGQTNIDLGPSTAGSTIILRNIVDLNLTTDSTTRRFSAQSWRDSDRQTNPDKFEGTSIKSLNIAQDAQMDLQLTGSDGARYALTSARLGSVLAGRWQLPSAGTIRTRNDLKNLTFNLIMPDSAADGGTPALRNLRVGSVMDHVDLLSNQSLGRITTAGLHHSRILVAAANDQPVDVLAELSFANHAASLRSLKISPKRSSAPAVVDSQVAAPVIFKLKVNDTDQDQLHIRADTLGSLNFKKAA